MQPPRDEMRRRSRTSEQDDAPASREAIPRPTLRGRIVIHRDGLLVREIAVEGAPLAWQPRGEVVMKRIAFPPGVEDADLPGMVHLQMVRQLTVSPESAAIDYVPIPTTGVATANAAGKVGTTVMAVALQGDRVQWRREVARARWASA